MVGITCNSRIIALICRLPFRWSTLLPITTSPSSFSTACTYLSTKSTKSKILDLLKTYIWKGFKRIRGKWGDPKISANPKVWTKILAGSGFHYRDGNHSTKDIIWGGDIFFTASELCFSWSAAPSWCATLPRTSSTSTISTAWLSRWGAWEAWFLLKAHCTTPLPYPIWASLLTVVSHLLLIVNASSNTLIYFLKVRRTTVFPSFFQSFQGVSLRIPSSDLASWNTFWVALPLQNIPLSRLCKRLKDSLNKKKDFSGWGERNCCERVQEAESFRPC